MNIHTHDGLGDPGLHGEDLRRHLGGAHGQPADGGEKVLLIEHAELHGWSTPADQDREQSIRAMALDLLQFLTGHDVALFSTGEGFLDPGTACALLAQWLHRPDLRPGAVQPALPETSAARVVRTAQEAVDAALPLEPSSLGALAGQPRDAEGHLYAMREKAFTAALHVARVQDEAVGEAAAQVPGHHEPEHYGSLDSLRDHLVRAHRMPRIIANSHAREALEDRHADMAGHRHG